MKTKDETDYNVAEDPAMSCGKCAAFTPPNKCSVVNGSISEQGTCKDFVAGNNAAPIPMADSMTAEAIMNDPAQDMASKMGF